ncbi:hypothetical protein ACFXNW_12490 [Nocardia sp. NPDC059180]|uniref:hypothetical protein n=1 Tax=Nocardia sp. NPDC059180 TaxID=3346761 RepID=UPI0036742558
MKRSTLVLITAGMILSGAGVVEIIGTDTAASGGAVHPAVIRETEPVRESPESYPNATVFAGPAAQLFSATYLTAAVQLRSALSAADRPLSSPAAAPRTYPG